MTKNQEVLGKVVEATMKSVAKEAGIGGNAPIGAAKTISDMIDTAIGMQLTVSISLFRENSFTGADEFLSTISDVSPQLIKDNGLEPLIKEWSGGGKYRGVIRGAGIPDKNFRIVIGGEPELPRPERTNQQSTAGGLQNMQALNAPMSMGAGNFLAGPGFANYMGMGRGGMGGGNDGQLGSVVQMLLATLMAKDNKPAGDSDAVQQAKEQTRQMEMQLTEERRRSEQAISDARHREEMAELRRNMEQIAKDSGKSKEDPTVSMIKALAPAAAIALPMMMDGKTKAALAQSDMVKNMLGVQKESSDKSLGMMEILLKQPTAEDKQAKQAETMANMMGNFMQLSGSMMSQMTSMQGDGGPPWLQLMRELISGMTEVGSQMFAGGPAPQEAIQGHVEVQGSDVPQLDAAAAAQQARAAMEASAGGNGDTREDADGAMSGIETPVRTSYHPGLIKIFDLVEKNGNPHEIAFRIWKDGTSGDVTSLAWFRDPEPFTFQLLGAFVDSSQMNITEERAKEIADALQEYHDHLNDKKTPEDYLKKYDIRITMPKKIMVDPLGASIDGKEQPTMGEPTNDGQVVRIEDVETPSEAVVPLPEGPQNTEPPVPPEKQEVIVIEGPQNAAPPKANEPIPSASDAIAEVKKIEGAQKSAQ